MIVVNLFGGMGNQLFQYFFGYALAKESGIPVTYATQKLKIGHFGFPLSFSPSTHGFAKVNEPFFHYQQIKAKSKTVYTGYWQSEKYFSKYRDDIIAMFGITPSTDGVSLHVRRGDYLNFPNHHPVQPIDYYVQATKMFPDKQVKVFSDDLLWCMENLPYDWKYSSIDNTGADDFAEMASYSNHVISNSSFSWWAAWLNGEKVVAPKKWLGKSLSHYKTTDLVPDRWQSI